MNLRHFGRAQQMWVLLVVCVVLFAVFLLLVPGLTFAMWWRALIAALLASIITIVLFQWWLRKVLQRRDSSIKLLNRITAGDLSLDVARDSTGHALGTDVRGDARAGLESRADDPPLRATGNRRWPRPAVRSAAARASSRAARPSNSSRRNRPPPPSVRSTSRSTTCGRRWKTSRRTRKRRRRRSWRCRPRSKK